MRGYYIQYSNNDSCPCWLVMRWGRIEQVCCTLEAAYRWLQDRIDNSDVTCR